MKRILFVDDETNVLDGLRRMLHPMRHEWEMHFVAEGAKAVALMEEHAIDVIVTDMRMPGMDGAELLNIVRVRWPQIVRIVLSGQSDRAMILRAVPSTHQFLSKPCEADTLKETIDRSCHLRELLGSEDLRNLFARLQSLPCLPDIYEQLVQALGDPNISMEAIGRIIGRDVGISAKILQLVNTPFFGICHHVASPAQAAALLGIDTIKGLVLSTQVFSNCREASKCFSSHEFRDHCMLTGAFARVIAGDLSSDHVTNDHAFLAGLLHDVGLLVIANNLPDVFTESIRLAHERGVPLVAVEREKLGANHAEIGAYLLALWGQPDPIVAAVAFHHAPFVTAGRPSIPMVAVHVADSFSHEFQKQLVEPYLAPLEMEFLRSTGLSDRLPRWRQMCQKLYERIGDHAASANRPAAAARK